MWALSSVARILRDPFYSGRASWLEAVVWDTIAAVLRDPARLAEKLETYRTKLGVREVEIVSEIEHLRRQLAEVGRQERKLLDSYLVEDVPMGVARERLDGITRRRAALQERLTAAGRQQAAQEAEEGQQAAACSRRFWTRSSSLGVPSSSVGPCPARVPEPEGIKLCRTSRSSGTRAGRPSSDGRSSRRSPRRW